MLALVLLDIERVIRRDLRNVSDGPDGMMLTDVSLGVSLGREVMVPKHYVRGSSARYMLSENIMYNKFINTDTQYMNRGA